MRISTSEILPKNSWVLNVDLIKNDAQKNYLKDLDLLDNLSYAFPYYSEGTTKICTASTYQLYSKQVPNSLFTSLDKEILKVWLHEQTYLPATVYFRIIPGIIVPKKDVQDGVRLVFNDSCPLPHTTAGITHTTGNQRVPPAINDLVQHPLGVYF